MFALKSVIVNPALIAFVLATPHPKGYVCYYAKTPPAINGRLDDASWQAAPWTDLFVDIEGDKKPRPRFRTRAKMLWDTNYFYIAAELQEPQVWATLTEHDSVIFQDNDFEIFMDPNGDNHQYYEIEINALNTVWDLRLVKPYKDGGPALNEWEIPGLKSAVHVDGKMNDPSFVNKGWTVEMAIPWKALAEFADRPAPPRHGDQWRLNFSRVEWRVEVVNGKYQKVPASKEDNWVWSPQWVVDMHRPENWGYVQFSKKPNGKDKFVPDITWPVRDYLHRIYYAQAAYKKSRGRYGTLADLKIPRRFDCEIILTADGYVASAKIAKRKLHIRQDSKIWES